MRAPLLAVGFFLCLGVCAPPVALADAACPNETLRSDLGSSRLPDCRAYELVTPSYKEGAPVQGLQGEFAVSPDGTRLIGTSQGVFAGAEAGGLFTSRLDGTAYELSRTSTGWQTSALGPPQSRYTDAGMYDVSADLQGTLWGLGTLSQPEALSDLYIEQPGGSFSEVGPVTPNPALANAGEYSYLGASADLSHILFSTQPGYRWPFDETNEGSSTLYEYAGTGNSAPSLVGVSGHAGSTDLVSRCGTLLGSNGIDGGAKGSLYNAISASGARVFFTAVGRDDEECGAPQPPVDELLVREEASPGEMQTVAISEPSHEDCNACILGPPGGLQDAVFQGASQDGSKVFFTSNQKLLPEASDGTENLYEYDFQAPAGEKLELVSAAGAPAEVQGVARVSEDGSHAYFVATGVLSQAANSIGASAIPGQDNLYVHERDTEFPDGRTSFIATLSPADDADWSRDDERPVFASTTGRYLIFQSQADLLHEGLVPGAAQVFQYDAQTGALVRASIGQGGYNDDGKTPVYGATLATQQADAFDSPTTAASMSAPEDGAVFFASADALTPQALSDQTDTLGGAEPNIYEYRAGSVYLISDGREESALDGAPSVQLLGSDPSGGDVFFTTADSLLTQDTDTQQDIYDARVEGGFPSPMPAASCVGEACRGPLSPAPTLPATNTADGETSAAHSIAGGVRPSFSPAPAPGWAIRSLAQPTEFSSVGDAQCEANPGGQVCDSYTLLVSNSGSQPSDGPVTIADTLPSGLAVAQVEGEDLATGSSLSCARTPLQCVDEVPVPPGDTLRVRISVIVSALITGPVTNIASVSGAGGSKAEANERTPIGSEPTPFGIADFALRALNADGTSDTQAGGHPDSLTASFDFSTGNQAIQQGAFYHSAQDVKDILLDLPPGLAVNTQAAPRCPLTALQLTVGRTACPAASRVGMLVLEYSGGRFRQSEGQGDETTALYNVVPEAGYPLELGASYLGHPIIIYGSLVRAGSGGYAVRLAVPGLSTPGLIGMSLTLFGDPAQPDGGLGPPVPMFANPADCSGGPLQGKLEVDTWQRPGQYQAAETVVYPDVSECDPLQFQPTLNLAPEVTQADEPSGYELQIRVPQVEDPFEQATPELKQAVVTFPAGVSLSPAAADGLVGCAATGPEGIDIGSDETGYAGQDLGDPEASELGSDGLYHAAPGHCPGAATVGTVEIETPLVGQPVFGHVYLAQPQCGGGGRPQCTQADAADGRLLGLYLEAAGSGVVLKLAGRLEANPATGQLMLRFDELPQLSISDLKLHLAGGPRALLSNPQMCGPATSSGDLSPWSSPETPDAMPVSTFDVDWDGSGGACPPSLPFEPSFSALVTAPAPGGSSPLIVTISREDRQQYLSRFSVRLPPGLAWMFSSVPPCEEPQAREGTCFYASEIGTTEVAVGAGSHPFWLPGRVYLTAGYRGAPYGLSIAVQMVAGPFDLGTVIVRAAVSVDPSTGALTISSDPLPQVLDGIPLRIRTLEVAIDHPHFVLNPTICTAPQIDATIEGAQGASVEASSPFVTPGCQNPPPASGGQTGAEAGSGTDSNTSGGSIGAAVTHKPPKKAAKPKHKPKKKRRRRGRQRGTKGNAKARNGKKGRGKRK